MVDTKYHSMFYTLDESEFDYLETKLQEYLHESSLYAIAHESDPKSHFHLIFQATEQDYINFNKHIVEKYKLRRTGRGGLIKYGKVKNIRNLERMLTYTLKDGNYRSNMDTTQINSYFEKSFKKVLKNDTIDNIVQHLDTLFETEDPADIQFSFSHVKTQFSNYEVQDFQSFKYDVLRPKILDYLVENNIPHRAIQLENFIYQFLCRTTHYDKDTKKSLLNSYYHEKTFRSI